MVAFRALIVASLALGGGSTAACAASEERSPYDATPITPSTNDARADAGLVAPDRDADAKLKLAVTRFFIGETDRGGRELPHAWQWFGENYDGLYSNYTLKGECLPPEDQAPYAATDGRDGIDNVWGERIVPMLEPWAKTPSKASDDALKAGMRRPIIMLGQLGGGQTGAATLRASLTYLLPSPAGQGEGGLSEPTLTTYEMASFANGVFDSGPAASPVTIELPIGPQVFRVVVQRLRLRFELTPLGKALGGQLSGAIKVVDLQTAVVDLVTRSAPAECGGARLEALKTSIASMPDVLAGGRTDADAGARCDAISFGVGFEAAPVEVTGTTSLPEALPPGCP